MGQIRALFWDVGGVLLTNAWDHEERSLAAERFHLDKSEFETRHKAAVPGFEEGKITLDEYLDRTIFYEPRDFEKPEFKSFLFSLTRPKPEVIEIARSASHRCLMCAINNESRELNELRIRKFGLLEVFSLFVSSCYVGIRKPEERIFRLALDLTQKPAEECCFIDDRPVNLEGAKQVGLRTVLMRDAAQLKRDLQQLGVTL